MQGLRNCAFEGYITMELGLDTRTADPDYIARTALVYLKEVESKLSEEKVVLSP